MTTWSLLLLLIVGLIVLVYHVTKKRPPLFKPEKPYPPLPELDMLVMRAFEALKLGYVVYQIHLVQGSHVHQKLDTIPFRSIVTRLKNDMRFPITLEQWKIHIQNGTIGKLLFPSHKMGTHETIVIKLPELHALKQRQPETALTSLMDAICWYFGEARTVSERAQSWRVVLLVEDQQMGDPNYRSLLSLLESTIAKRLQQIKFTHINLDNPSTND